MLTPSFSNVCNAVGLFITLALLIKILKVNGNFELKDIFALTGVFYTGSNILRALYLIYYAFSSTLPVELEQCKPVLIAGGITTFITFIVTIEKLWKSYVSKPASQTTSPPLQPQLKQYQVPQDIKISTRQTYPAKVKNNPTRKKHSRR